MDKKIIFTGIAAAIVIIAAAVALCFYLFKTKAPQTPPPAAPAAENQNPAKETPAGIDQSGEAAAAENAGQVPATEEEKMIEDITSSVQANPVEDKPDINPASQTNPIRKIKTNPFE